MSGMGEIMSDFIKALYWVLGIAAAIIVVLLGVIAWLLFR